MVCVRRLSLPCQAGGRGDVCEGLTYGLVSNVKGRVCEVIGSAQRMRRSETLYLRKTQAAAQYFHMLLRWDGVWVSKDCLEEMGCWQNHCAHQQRKWGETNQGIYNVPNISLL